MEIECWGIFIIKGRGVSEEGREGIYWEVVGELEVVVFWGSKNFKRDVGK